MPLRLPAGLRPRTHGQNDPGVATNQSSSQLLAILVVAHPSQPQSLQLFLLGRDPDQDQQTCPQRSRLSEGHHRGGVRSCR